MTGSAERWEVSRARSVLALVVRGTCRMHHVVTPLSMSSGPCYTSLPCHVFSTWTSTSFARGSLPVSLAFRLPDHLSHRSGHVCYPCWFSRHSAADRIGCLVADPRSPLGTEFDPLGVEWAIRRPPRLRRAVGLLCRKCCRDRIPQHMLNPPGRWTFQRMASGRFPFLTFDFSSS